MIAIATSTRLRPRRMSDVNRGWQETERSMTPVKSRIRSAKFGAVQRRAEPLRDKLLFDMGVPAAPFRHAKRAGVELFRD